MAQGHHRQSGARSNVALYGRDDVHPAIQLQYQIIQRIASGFRPVIPLLRGGAKPVLDKPVSVAPPSEEVTSQAQTQLCLPILMTWPTPTLVSLMLGRPLSFRMTQRFQ